MRIDRLWLADFRNYRELSLELAPGLTAVVGANGEGKSNLLEALGYLATLESFRGAPREALVRVGSQQATVRAEGDADGRRLLVEAEITTGRGRDRVLVNRQPLRRARDLLGVLRVTVFAPDDLELVKGGPSARRRYIDDLLVALHPKYDALRADVDRALKQRNSLLKQCNGRLDEAAGFTLDVWDAKLAEHGEALATAREETAAELAPVVSEAYDQVAGRAPAVGLRYERSWAGGLLEALQESRKDDLRRGVTLVGPHRDDLGLSLAGLPARTHASQGEQRSLALALRLGSHHLVGQVTGSFPLLLLDDVFSELDPARSAALLRHLPGGQSLLTTASALPEEAKPDRVVRIAAGAVVALGGAA